MILTISDVGDVEILKPLHGEPALLVPVVTERGQRLDLRFNPAGYHKLDQFLAALSTLASQTPEVKQLGEPLQ